MQKAYKHLKKLIVAAIGLPIFILGIILVPLPGPGLLVCLLGLLILSLEFEFAEKPLNKAKSEFKKIVEQSKKRAKLDK